MGVDVPDATKEAAVTGKKVGKKSVQPAVFNQRVKSSTKTLSRCWEAAKASTAAAAPAETETAEADLAAEGTGLCLHGVGRRCT